MMYRTPNIGTFFTTGNMDALWNFVGVLLKYVAPGVMIVVALLGVGMLIKLIIKTFKKGSDPEDDLRRRKDSDDYDMKYY